MSIKKAGPQKKKLDAYTIRRYLIMATIVLVVGLTALNIWLARGMKQEITSKQMSSSTAGFGDADIGGDFIMNDQNGNTVPFSSTNGKLRLVFFGFTHCPDICPVSMLTITNILNTLGTKASQVTPVFITVDPERDTPSVMKEYVSNFHPSFVALTGTKEETDKAAQAFKAYYSVQASPPTDDQHTAHEEHGGHAEPQVQVDHSGFIYLLDQHGKYLAHFEHDVAEQKVLDAIQPYLQ